MSEFLRDWAEQLAVDPAAAVDGVLTGRTARGTLQRAEADDFFVAALAQAQAGEDRERLHALFDQGLLAWLEARRDWEPGRIARFGAGAYIAQVDRALVTVTRLRPARTAQSLASDHLSWEEWLSPLRRRDWIDLVDAYDLALAANQNDRRFVARWFDRIADAAWCGPGWRRTLRTGLIGLRKLPHPPGSQPELESPPGSPSSPAMHSNTRFLPRPNTGVSSSARRQRSPRCIRVTPNTGGQCGKECSARLPMPTGRGRATGLPNAWWRLGSFHLPPRPRLRSGFRARRPPPDVRLSSLACLRGRNVLR